MNAVPLRVAIFGPESTGKTQLAAKLAAHFQTRWVPEYARELWDRQGVITLEDIPALAREQWRREDAAAGEVCHLLDDKLSSLIFCDTEALTTVLWSDLLYGTCPDDIRRGAERRAKNYALYLLLDVDVPFAPDPQRCFPEGADREKAMRVWRGALERRGLPFEEIRGDWLQREQAAITAVKRLLAPAS